MHRARNSDDWVRELARSVAGGVVAVAAVSLGIVALNLLVDRTPPADGPVVVLPTRRTPTGTPSQPAPTSAAASAPASAATSPTASPAPTSASPAATAAARLPLVVLNSSRRTGLAARAAREFERGGWPVRETGNYRDDPLAATTVFYEPGQEASARRLMAEFPDVEQMRPRFAGLPGRGLTVVLTADYPA